MRDPVDAKPGSGWQVHHPFLELLKQKLRTGACRPYIYTAPPNMSLVFAVKDCTVDNICILPEPSYKTLLSCFQISWFHSLSFRYDWRFATLQTTTLFSHRLLHLCNTLQSLFWPKGRRIRYASDVIDGQGKEGENNDNQKEKIQGCLHGDLVPQSCLTKSSQYFLAVVNHFSWSRVTMQMA